MATRLGRTVAKAKIERGLGTERARLGRGWLVATRLGRTVAKAKIERGLVTERTRLDAFSCRWKSPTTKLPEWSAILALKIYLGWYLSKYFAQQRHGNTLFLIFTQILGPFRRRGFESKTFAIESNCSSVTTAVA